MHVLATDRAVFQSARERMFCHVPLTHASCVCSRPLACCRVSLLGRIDDVGRTCVGHTDVVSTGRRERLAGVRAFATVAGEVFDGADLSSVCLDRLRLDRCSLVAADLRHATLDGCSFRFCDLRRARLRGASLRFARLAGCDLREADLRGCDLTGASFGFVNTGAPSGLSDLTGAVMDGAVLTAATFDRVTGWPPC
jgi:uncharacterized protein YjbI with pentapeptide repeats